MRAVVAWASSWFVLEQNCVDISEVLREMTTMNHSRTAWRTRGCSGERMGERDFLHVSLRMVDPLAGLDTQGVIKL